MTRCALWVFFVLLGTAFLNVDAQDRPDFYGSRNTFGAGVEYSNDSSHIALGSSENLKLGAIELEYQRRLFTNRYLAFSYALEFRPVVLESTPTSITTQVFVSPKPVSFTLQPTDVTKCTVGTSPFQFTTGTPPVMYSGYFSNRCGRDLTYAQGLSPIGFRVNPRPRGRLQPTFSTFVGYLLSAKPLPVANAGSYNFAFELGGGLEYFLTRKNSMRLEYQVHHYSNNRTANANPGVDNGIFKLTYSFGR